MSSTNRGAVRNKNDRYITPDHAIESLLSVLDLDRMKKLSFCEPCMGNGAIYNKIPALQKEYAEIDIGIDYLTTSFSDHVVITNPPFSLALEFLEKSLSEADTVIYLLRLNFLGSRKRKEFWNKNRPSHVLTLSKRPSFKNNGETDSTEYAWFCWDTLGIVQLEKGIHVL